MIQESKRLSEAAPEPGTTTIDFRQMLKWIVAGNPFYPLSAVLVLLGVFLLSEKERLFDAEFAQLIFNFGSLELYGVLTALTALYLVRRGIYYDTVMLLVLAVLPILVPFILISQAAFIGNLAMTGFCITAAVLGWAQFIVLRRGAFASQLNGGIAAYFATGLLLNVAMPVGIKLLHANVDALVWANSLELAGNAAWNLVLPLLAACAAFIAPMKDRKFGDCRVGWLGTALPMLLLAGTAVHVWSLGYVYAYRFEDGMLIPMIWTVSWVLWWRRDEWLFGPVKDWKEFTILIPVGIGGCTFLVGDSLDLFLMNGFNALAASVLLLRRPGWKVFSVILPVSLLCTLRAVPASWLISISPGSNHLEIMLLVISLFLLGLSVFRKQPVWGLVAALSVYSPAHQFWATSPEHWLVVNQVALLVWWLHSLRSKPGVRLALFLQSACVAIWSMHTFVWMFGHGGQGQLLPVLFALVYFVTALTMIWFRREMRYYVVAGLVLLMISLNAWESLAAMVRNIPMGLLLLAGGVVLFGAGTVLARCRGALLQQETLLKDGE